MYNDWGGAEEIKKKNLETPLQDKKYRRSLSKKKNVEACLKKKIHGRGSGKKN